ncbi:CDP-alcohol phosphatidyltransferase family protein [Candidatus Chloroploca sp. M-50]|uniref:CDP-alcohol phosphatidyltransferase family protein n=1 Tax=Candidatus Chloroploca mongolica TaxID=2528176 RepID=A0ABS4DFF5_9CHLR|nr:CDP-alcohol phosphatidyltransferase family protein [Candidatus Chloroploca mongolica]MBP1468162.1 CDP-alcohol phosphatidyltransferase family protein [Candidatus Chloroploca mongolica]
MIDKALREPKESLLGPLVRGPLRRIHPTSVTVVAAIVGVAAAVAAWQGLYVAALILWAVNRILDGLDGTLARLTDQQSDLGAYLDILLDHLVYAAIPIGLALAVNTPAGYLALAALLASFYLNGASWMYLAALLEKRQAGARKQGELTTVTMPGGLIEGAETVVCYTLFLLMPGALVPLFSLMAVLVVITAGQRLIWALRNL